MAGWFNWARSIWQYGRAGRYDLIWSAIRVPVAFMVAPISAPIVMMLFAVPELLQNPESLLQNLEWLFQTPLFILTIGYGFVIAYLVTLTVGVLLFCILRKLKLTGFWIAPTLGFMMPVILISLIIGPPPGSAILFLGLPGAAVGAILWLIARPDRIAA